MNDNSLSVHDGSEQPLVEPFQSLSARFGGNASLLARVSKKFAPEMQLQMNALHKGIEQADSNAAKAALHTLKGVASTVGAIQLSARFAQFELKFIKEPAVAPEQVVGLAQYQDLLELIARSDRDLQALLINNGIELG